MHRCGEADFKKILDKYIKNCLKAEDSGPKHFERFIHGGVLPTLQRFRDAKLLKKGNDPEIY